VEFRIAVLRPSWLRGEEATMRRFSSRFGVLGGGALALAIGLAAPSRATAGNPNHQGSSSNQETCTTDINRVCDPDTGATTCQFHLLNSGNGEYVTGTYRVAYVTDVCSGGGETSTSQDVRILGKGTGDTTGTKYRL